MPNTISLSAANSILSKIALLTDNEQDQFLKQVTEIIHTYVDIYFLMFFLLETGSEWVIFRVGTSGEASNTLLSKGHRLKIGTAVSVDKIVLRGQDISIFSLPITSSNNLEIQFEENQSPNYLSPWLPETRLELLLPLRFEEKIVGAWHISSVRDDGFELDDIIHFQLLADQIAVRLSLLSR
jgi:transcriptional regulator with GAF, ATPase, and Fis domain